MNSESIISEQAQDTLSILQKWHKEKHIYDLFKIEEMEVFPSFQDDTENIIMSDWLCKSDIFPISNAKKLNFENREDTFFVFSETDIDMYALWVYPELLGEPPVLKFSDGGDIEVIASSMAEFVCRLGRNLSDEYLDDLEDDYGFDSEEEALEAIFSDYAEFQRRIMMC